MLRGLNQSKYTFIIHTEYNIIHDVLHCMFFYIMFRQRQLYIKYYLPWAIQTGLNSNFMLNIYFENRWEQPIDELHKELNIKLLKIIN